MDVNQAHPLTRVIAVFVWVIQEKDMQRAVAAERRLADTTNRCWYCFKSPSIRKHLIIALGEHSLLMLPPKGSKMPGHCIIVPQDVRIVWPGVCVHVCVCVSAGVPVSVRACV